MAAKIAIRDVGRMLDVLLSDGNRISKMYPSHPGANLKSLLGKDGIEKSVMDNLSSEDLEKAKTIRDLAAEDSTLGQMLRTDKNMEGSVRNKGIHYCMIINKTVYIR